VIGDRDLQGLMAALTADPTDSVVVAALADWVAERGGNDSPLRTRVAYVWVCCRWVDGEYDWFDLFTTKDLAVTEAVRRMNIAWGEKEFEKVDFLSGRSHWVRGGVEYRVYKEMVNEE
jgi:hypothetical protein